MKEKSEFSKNLKLIRIQKNLTQKELGIALGFSNSTINDWENRGTEPNIETLIKIAKFFNVSVDYLIGLED